MTETELIAHIAGKEGLKKADVRRVLACLKDTIVSETKRPKGKVILAKCCKFERKHYKARTGINPQTKRKMQIPARTRIKVTALGALRKSR